MSETQFSTVKYLDAIFGKSGAYGAHTEGNHVHRPTYREDKDAIKHMRYIHFFCFFRSDIIPIFRSLFFILSSLAP